MIALLLALSVAQAQTCDVKALRQELADASPQSLPRAYSALAACDPAAAKAEAAKVFPRALPGSEGNTIARTAISVGASEETRKWITTLQSDERSTAVAALGNACGEGDAKVAHFLADTAVVLGDKFWTERWYRSLADCRTPEIQELLKKEVQAQSTDRSRYFAVLEVFSRNLGKEAIPQLKALALTMKDPEEQIYVVNAFADAAQVGSKTGQDAEATQQAIAAIVELAPKLSPKALDQARITLTTLGAPAEADKLAILRYADKKGADGMLRYGAIAVETATCKNGKVNLGIHTGELVEPGVLWPNDVASIAPGLITSTWKMDAAAKCKGTGSTEVVLTETPLDAAALAAWKDEQLRKANALPADKREVFQEQPLTVKR